MTLVYIIFMFGFTTVQSGLCELRGGGARIDLGGYQYCANKFNDVEKPCADNSQCEGLSYLPCGYKPKSNSALIGICATSEIEANQPCYRAADGKTEMGAF